MIGRLKGTLVHKQPPWLLVDVAGVGYELEAPMSTFYDLPEAGREVTLHVHHAVKEDSVSLYGFLTESERRVFRDVQKVTGIGAKIALAILSGASVEEFARLVQTSDVTALTRIPGIGKKTAERIVVELRDRAADFGAGTAGPPPKSAARSRSSTTMRSAVFLPMPGMRVSAVTSLVCTSRANSSTLTPESTASAIFAPTPETRCTSRNRRRSFSRRKPYSDTLSSFCA